MLPDLDALSSAAVPSSLTTLVIEGEVDVLSVARAAADTWEEVSYFRGLDGQEMVGLGCAWRSNGAGDGNRFANAAADFLSQEFAPQAIAMVGASFEDEADPSREWGDFPSLDLVVPQVLVHNDGETTNTVVTLLGGEDPSDILWRLRQLTTGNKLSAAASEIRVESNPSAGDYRQSVADGVAHIQAGELLKLVLARRLRITTDTKAEPFEVMAALGEEQPGCYLYGWKRGQATFIGASPELLAERSGGLARSVPLAGTAPRGRNDGTDVQIAAALLLSDKDRYEHSVMIEDITQRLSPLVDSLTISQPTVEKFRHLQHLVSQITGPVLNGETVLDLGAAIHPTPAVGGVPREKARSLIRELEGFDRGWYAGAVGWIKPDGDGQLVVAIRCALLKGHQAVLYAGNGIVGESDPQLELEETRWKFRALLRHLGEA